ncbi:1-aminocyclopropane-1-carboxylate deaminase/D-cysteine desulfhydrase, partial [Thermoproteota archaeon]
MIELFNTFPNLADTVPHISLGDFPTPVKHLKKLGESLGIEHLYVKCDSLSGKDYGGNKIRKLEFLLGQAKKEDKKHILTFGGAGSNHALATAIYSQNLGLSCHLLLTPQPNSKFVRRNLLRAHLAGADLIYCPSLKLLPIYTAHLKLKLRLQTRDFPYTIPMGGTNELGILGYINAAYELKKQIDSGLIPEPDLLYLPLGSMGTAVGLIIGFKLLKMKTKVMAVRIIDTSIANKNRFMKLVSDTKTYLTNCDPAFPFPDVSKSDILIRNDCYGNSYGAFTPE